VHGRRALLRSALVLAASAGLVPPLAALAPLALAPLFAVAACATLALDGRVVVDAVRWVWPLALLLFLLAVWATLSAVWSILPRHSVIEGLRLLLVAASGVVLLAAGCTLSARERQLVAAAACIGLVLGLALLLFKASIDALVMRLILGHAVPLTHFDRGATTLVLALWPVLAAATGRHAFAGFAFALASVASVFALDSDAAVLAIVVGFAGFAAGWLAPRLAAASLAIGLALAAAALPLAIPDYSTVLAVHQHAPWIKWSGIHRLLIWRFTADRIGERPLLGWGMDASREIPGGKTHFADLFPNAGLPSDAEALPLHPHNAVLQWEVELGIPGTVLCLAIVWWGLWRIGFAAALPRGARAGALAWAVSALVIALLSYGIWQAWWLSALFLTAATYAAIVPGPDPA